MTEPVFTPINPEPARDRWQRPLVIPPGGGKPTAYTRCTTYVDVLEDKYNLQKWMQRMVAVGLSQRSDLHLAAASMASDPDANKKRLDDLCEQAVEAAKGSAKATIGSALHAFIERINLGQDPGPIPAEYQRHIDNYLATVTAAGFRPVHVERFTVQDDLRVGGTPDLIAEIAGVDGLVVCDLKTGPSTLRYGSLRVAMQLAVYAHSQLYDPADGARTAIEGLRTDKGVVVALDSDTAECSLHIVDLTAGWEAVQVATQVRAWRTRKDLLTEWPKPEPRPALAEAKPIGKPDPQLGRALLAAIAESASREALMDLWSRAGEAWGDEHTEAAKRRLETLAA